MRRAMQLFELYVLPRLAAAMEQAEIGTVEEEET